MGPPSRIAFGTSPGPGRDTGARALSPTWPPVNPETTSVPRQASSATTSTTQCTRRFRGTRRGMEGLLVLPGRDRRVPLGRRGVPCPVAACTFGSCVARGSGFFSAAFGFRVLVVAWGFAFSDGVSGVLPTGTASEPVAWAGDAAAGSSSRLTRLRLPTLLGGSGHRSPLARRDRDQARRTRLLRSHDLSCAGRSLRRARVAGSRLPRGVRGPVLPARAAGPG